MKKLIWIICGLVGFAMLIPIICLCRIYMTCGNLDRNTVIQVLIGSDPITKHSPDGQYYFVTEVWRRKDSKKDAYLCVLLKIFDKSGKLIQEINTHASDVHRWEALWKKNNTILMKSSDIGDYEYEQQKEGVWRKKDITNH